MGKAVSNLKSNNNFKIWLIIFYLCLSLALLSPPKWLDTELDLLGEVGLLDLDLWRPRGLPEATLSSDLEPGLCDMEDDLK